MSIATLTFTLPDDEDDFQAAQQGGAARSLLWNIDQHLRAKIKHGSLGGEAFALAAEIRAMILEAPGVTLD